MISNARTSLHFRHSLVTACFVHIFCSAHRLHYFHPVPCCRLYLTAYCWRRQLCQLLWPWSLLWQL